MTRRQRRLLEAAKGRHGRRKHGVSLCEGVRCVREALCRRPHWGEFLLVAESFSSGSGEMAGLIAASGLPLYEVPDHVLESFSDTKNPQGILLLFRPSRDVPLHEAGPDYPIALVLDRLSEPGNMGTILRTAWAVGLKQVWLTDGCVDPYAPKAVRAGMGAQFALDVIQGPELEAMRWQLKELGYGRLWLSKPGDGVSSCGSEFQLDRSAIVIGNEAEGVADIEGADIVTIPMPGDAESLNASQAATILLYEAVRRDLIRRQSHGTIDHEER